MKTRFSLVSNSSSSSFIIRGMKIPLSVILSKIGKENFSDDEIDEKEYVIEKNLKDKFGLNLTVKSVENYFNRSTHFTDVIIGTESDQDFEDGEITELILDESQDNYVIESLHRIGIENPKLSTFIQYVSNDNV